MDETTVAFGDSVDHLMTTDMRLPGFLMKKFDYEPAPLMLAFVIGPMLESSLRKSLILSHGSLSIFWTRPISMALAIIFLLIVLSGGLSSLLKHSRSIGQGSITRD